MEGRSKEEAIRMGGREEDELGNGGTGGVRWEEGGG